MNIHFYECMLIHYYKIRLLHCQGMPVVECPDCSRMRSLSPVKGVLRTTDAKCRPCDFEALGGHQRKNGLERGWRINDERQEQILPFFS